MSGSVCLLASYPKSGNTWLRAMLTACLRQRVDINQLVGENVLIHPDWIENESGIDPAVLSLEQLNELRARLLMELGRTPSRPTFVKTHSSNLELASGRYLFTEATGKVVLVVRHPFDVAVSYSHFISRPCEAIVDTMGRAEALIDRPGNTRPQRLPESMGSWAGNFRSWTDRGQPTLIVRYEDMLNDPAGILSSVVEFAGLAFTDEAIEQAVAGASFERLQQLEEKGGFRQRPATGGRMFRQGRKGAGRSSLDTALKDHIVESCGSVMESLGYTTSGEAEPIP